MQSKWNIYQKVSSAMSKDSDSILIDEHFRIVNQNCIYYTESDGIQLNGVIEKYTVIDGYLFVIIRMSRSYRFMIVIGWDGLDNPISKLYLLALRYQCTSRSLQLFDINPEEKLIGLIYGGDLKIIKTISTDELASIISIVTMDGEEIVIPLALTNANIEVICTEGTKYFKEGNSNEQL